MVLDYTWLLQGGTGCYLRVLGQNRVILDQNRAVLFASVVCFQKIFGLHGLNHQIIEYWVSRGWYWLLLGGTGSVKGGTGRYLVILDQNRAVLVASVICFQKIFGLHGLNHQIIEYLVSRGRYWLVLGVTGSEQGGTGCQHDELSENIWFAWSKPSNH